MDNGQWAFTEIVNVMTLGGSVDKVWICWSNIYALIRQKKVFFFYRTC